VSAVTDTVDTRPIVEFFVVIFELDISLARIFAHKLALLLCYLILELDMFGCVLCSVCLWLCNFFFFKKKIVWLAFSVTSWQKYGVVLGRIFSQREEWHRRLIPVLSDMFLISINVLLRWIYLWLVWDRGIYIFGYLIDIGYLCYIYICEFISQICYVFIVQICLFLYFLFFIHLMSVFMFQERQVFFQRMNFNRSYFKGLLWLICISLFLSCNWFLVF
jgi:hypothetical protein